MASPNLLRVGEKPIAGFGLNTFSSPAVTVQTTSQTVGTIVPRRSARASS